MKKTILVVLMVILVATPCFAQEVETDGFFSIEGTTWGCIGVRNSWFEFLLGDPFMSLYYELVYFTDRSVQTSSGNIGILGNVDTYSDFLLFSVAWRGSNRFASYPGFMILQPALGVGMFNSIIWWSFCWGAGCGDPIPIGVNFGYMFKVDDDDWSR